MNDTGKTLLALMAHPGYRRSVKSVGVFRFSANYRYEWQAHSEIEINCVESGCCMLGVDDVYISLKAGEGIVLFPGVNHCFLADVRQSCRITQVEFRLNAPESLCGNLDFLRSAVLGASPRFVKLHDCRSVIAVMKQLCDSHRKKSPDMLLSLKEDFAYAQLYLCLSEKIAEEKKRAFCAQESIIGPILQYIQSNLSEKLDMEALCAQYGLSSRYVRRQFQKETGMSSSQYITMLRISKAKELLWDLSQSVTEVAARTGFGSSQYFSRVFRAYTGQTPKEYRYNLYHNAHVR